MNAAVQHFTPSVSDVPTAALPFQPFDGQLAHLPPDWIAVQPGFNPRTFFEDAEFAALVASVGRQGVLQAVWVRPQEAYDPAAPRFWLIAGERRWRAARAAGLASVPATIRLADTRQGAGVGGTHRRRHHPVVRPASPSPRGQADVPGGVLKGRCGDGRWLPDGKTGPASLRPFGERSLERKNGLRKTGFGSNGTPFRTLARALTARSGSNEMDSG